MKSLKIWDIVRLPIYCCCFFLQVDNLGCRQLGGPSRIHNSRDYRQNRIQARFPSVLRIQDVYPGSEFFPSRIQDQRDSEFKYFQPNKLFLSSRKYDPGCSYPIRILFFYQRFRTQYWFLLSITGPFTGKTKHIS
jgi:hypothetical protein